MKIIKKMKINKKVKRLFTYALLSVLILGCRRPQESRFVCNCEQQKQLQEFVQKSIKPSNNMSDEEMEDVISQLRKDGVMIFCKQQPIWVHSDGTIDWSKQKVDSCEMIMVSW